MVDDDENVRSVGVDVLEGLGYSVVEAADAAAALRILEDLQRPQIICWSPMSFCRVE
jgi:CheY-like chemotaxis protein